MNCNWYLLIYTAVRWAIISNLCVRDIRAEKTFLDMLRPLIGILSGFRRRFRKVRWSVSSIANQLRSQATKLSKLKTRKNWSNPTNLFIIAWPWYVAHFCCHKGHLGMPTRRICYATERFLLLGVVGSPASLVCAWDFIWAFSQETNP